MLSPVTEDPKSKNASAPKRLVIRYPMVAFLVATLAFSVQAWAQNREQISYGPEGAQQARIFLRPAVAELLLRALESDALIEGTIETADDEILEQSYELEDGTGVLRLESEGRRRFFLNPFRNRTPRTWDLGLSPAMPIDLTIEAGVGRVELDLRNLNLTALDVTTGVGESVITLPSQGRFRANIESGVGETTIRIPEGLAARVRISSGIGSSNVLGNFERQGDEYVSPGYDEAESRVALEVETGIREVTIETVARE